MAVERFGGPIQMLVVLDQFLLDTYRTTMEKVVSGLV